MEAATDAKDKRFEHPGHTLPEPWNAIALRHCAAAHALYTNEYTKA